MVRLFQRKDSPYWWAEIRDEGSCRPPYRVSTRIRDRKAADVWAAARELELAKASAGVPFARPVALLRAVAIYLEESEPPAMSAGWWQSSSSWWRSTLLPYFGDETNVCDLTFEAVGRFRAEQMKRLGRRGTLRPSTVNRIMAVGARFYRWAIRQGFALENPFKGHGCLREPVTHPPEFEDEVIDELIAELPTRWRHIFDLANETGLRRSELGRLRREDISSELGLARVVSSYDRGTTKNGETREVPLTARAKQLLDEIPTRKDGFVVGKVGDPRWSLRKAFERLNERRQLLELEPLPRVTLHAFRHYALTRLGEAGAALHELMDIGGHRTPQMARRYMKSRRTRLRAVADAIDAQRAVASVRRASAAG